MLKILSTCPCRIRKYQKQNAKIKAVENVIDKQSYEDMKAKFDAANLNLIKAKINIAYYKNIMAKKNCVHLMMLLSQTNLYKWAKE